MGKRFQLIKLGSDKILWAQKNVLSLLIYIQIDNQMKQRLKMRAQHNIYMHGYPLLELLPLTHSLVVEITQILQACR